MKKLIISLILITASFTASAAEIVGYIYRGDSILHLINDDIIQQNNSLAAHIKEITVIAPQAYQVNEKGTVWGAVDPVIVRLAKKNHTQLMPLVTNADFDSARLHNLLNNPEGQKRAVEKMVALCVENDFAGLQIDFEHVLMTDKDSYTHFFQEISKAMHTKNFRISAAIFPRDNDRTPPSDRLRSTLERWSGGYDYAALGAAADFVTLMAYDQHGEGTTPGSACEPPWAEKIVEYAVKYIPSEKISLGIPVHSDYWFTGSSKTSTHLSEADLTYPQLQYLIDKFNIKLQWDNKNKVSYAIFSNNNLNEYIYAENLPAFKAKFELVKKYNLRGLSLWHIGTEDPAIWKVIAKPEVKNENMG